MPAPTNSWACWWHARDYGFLAANPFGVSAFSGGGKSFAYVRKDEHQPSDNTDGCVVTRLYVWEVFPRKSHYRRLHNGKRAEPISASMKEVGSGTAYNPPDESVQPSGVIAVTLLPMSSKSRTNIAA